MRKNIAYSLLFFLFPLISRAQGVRFEDGLSWQEVVAKARSEQKYIFVDCYTTWCGWCKKMDKEVYPNDTLGNYMNSNFISVKLQMDKSDTDNVQVKNWYETASEFAKNYDVHAFPSFLFFSPDGQPVHQVAGYRSASDFIQLGKDAHDPKKQIYASIRNYRPGTLDTAELLKLAHSLVYVDRRLMATVALEYLGKIPPEQVLARENADLIRDLSRDDRMKDWAVHYIEQMKPGELLSEQGQSLAYWFSREAKVQEKVRNYMVTLSGKRIEEKANLLLVASFPKLIHVRDRFFNVFYKKGVRSDATLERKGLSEYVVDNVIYNDLIAPDIKVADESGMDMDWGSLYEKIRSKTDAACAKRNIISSKVDFYRDRTKNAEKQNSEDKWKWGKLFADAYASQKETYGFKMENYFYIVGNGKDLESSIYRYCNDARIINEALDWMEKVMRVDPGTEFSYVYAGLLYKAGKTREAVAWQRMTLQLLEGRCSKAKKDPLTDKSYLEQQAILDKMQKKEKFENLIRWDADSPR
ncbi:MAG: thioredoxin family protein [Bacteroidota bacterium]|nr:thioredoxin family protein [Bacteroidota bacterium]MDP4245366.1 thioredoxin family protein [Bacteroidota bacterium]MDP4256047.1 thioredoxin family protein [Bacteroidota bacterium]MDP4258052.1 thioredoxin family protein [Bacteroidota bacterium]